MSQGDGAVEEDVKGPWNSGEQWQHVSNRDEQAAVDGGDGSAGVKLPAQDKKLMEQAAARTASRTDVDPTTGADLGAGPGSGATKKHKQ
jgi:Mn-containing catalase